MLVNVQAEAAESAVAENLVFTGSILVWIGVGMRS